MPDHEDTRPPCESKELNWESALQDPGLRLDVEEKPVEDPGFPWPKKAHVYDCIFAVSAKKDGILVDGPQEILYYCSEVDFDLESITDLPLDKMENGVYRGKFKYWASNSYCYGSGETEFEDGFYVTDIVKVAM